MFLLLWTGTVHLFARQARIYCPRRPLNELVPVNGISMFFFDSRKKSKLAKDTVFTGGQLISMELILNKSDVNLSPTLSWFLATLYSTVAKLGTIEKLDPLTMGTGNYLISHAPIVLSTLGKLLFIPLGSIRHLHSLFCISLPSCASAKSGEHATAR